MAYQVDTDACMQIEKDIEGNSRSEKLTKCIEVGYKKLVVK